jgi:hypothetical protein
MNQISSVDYSVKVVKRLLESKQLVTSFKVQKFKKLEDAVKFYNWHLDHPFYDEGVVINRVIISKQEFVSGKLVSDKVIKKSPLNLL